MSARLVDYKKESTKLAFLSQEADSEENAKEKSRT